MKKRIRKILNKLAPLLDILLFPLILITGFLLRAIRNLGITRFPLCRKMLLCVGVFPIRDHYYDPFIKKAALRYSLSLDRNLQGIDWNIDEQLQLLKSFSFNDGLKNFSHSKTDDVTFFIDNLAFSGGDAEYWYNIIRLKKPNRIIEVGSGLSTLMAIQAIKDIKNKDSSYKCEHICIEPYENSWLEKTDVVLIKKKVEDVDKKLFSELGENDFLFIDSSHVIRPQGDVLFEFFEILPALKKGVIVHIHDIFSPKDYPEKWVIDENRFFNEQYLLEAFLMSNKEWKVIGAVNLLRHKYYQDLKAKAPFLSEKNEPGSFYIQKNV